MSIPAPRLLALGLGVLAAAPLALWLWPRAEDSPLAWVEADLDGLHEVLSELIETGSQGLVRRPLDERAVRALMPLRGSRRQYDPHCYFTYRPLLELEIPFREHPDGSFLRRTNSLGLRMDEEICATARPRVLVTGDSHIDGMCANAEALPHRLELELKGELADVQVWNSAHGAYGLYHYLGVLERFLDLGHVPSLFVMVVFGGNDFAEAPLLTRAFEGKRRTAWPTQLVKLRKEQQERHAAPLGQGGMAVQHFHLFPEDVSLALRAAAQVTAELRALCHAHDIDLCVVYLPAPLELPAQADLAQSEEALRAFGRTLEEASVLGSMADEYLAFLAAERIEHVDLREDFRSAGELLYWRSDLHLNLAGQRRAAQVLAPLARRLLATREE